jgi:hypothetical protein
MDIQGASMESAQARLLDQVGTTMLSKTLKGTEEAAAELLKSLGSVAPLPEGSGSKLDFLA